MARGMDIEPFVLRRTLARYNKAVAEKKDADFGKTVFLQTIEKPPFYWGKEVLSVHNTLGGISTDTACRVRKVGGGVIEGLYAAGDSESKKTEGTGTNRGALRSFGGAVFF